MALGYPQNNGFVICLSNDKTLIYSSLGRETGSIRVQLSVEGPRGVPERRVGETPSKAPMGPCFPQFYIFFSIHHVLFFPSLVDFIRNASGWRYLSREPLGRVQITGDDSVLFHIAGRHWMR